MLFFKRLKNLWRLSLIGLETKKEEPIIKLFKNRNKAVIVEMEDIIKELKID